MPKSRPHIHICRILKAMLCLVASLLCGNGGEASAQALDFKETYQNQQITLPATDTMQLALPSDVTTLWVEVRAHVKGNRNCHNLSKQRWGLAWTDSTSHRYAIEVRWGNTDRHDLTDQRYLQLSATVDDSTLATKRFYKDVDLHDGANSLAVYFANGTAAAYVGDRNLSDAIPLPFDIPIPTSAEIFTATPLTIESIYTKSRPDYAGIYAPTWTYDELKRHITASTDPMEGFWTYFDRTTDPKLAQIGGRYTLATVSNHAGGYDMLIVDGADINPSIWPTGTLKGTLTPTIFVDTYRLTWRDSSGRWLDAHNDLSATVENSALLILNFPTLQATLRLSRIPITQLR